MARKHAPTPRSVKLGSKEPTEGGGGRPAHARADPGK